MRIKKPILFSFVVLLSGCATAPNFVVTDSPQNTYTFDVQTETDSSRFKGVTVVNWLEAKAASISQSKRCTHFRKLSSDRSRDHNFWTSSTTYTNSMIYECVNISDHENVITSKDTITINDGNNVGNSSRIYRDIEPILFQHRELIAKISQNEKE